MVGGPGIARASPNVSQVRSAARRSGGSSRPPAQTMNVAMAFPAAGTAERAVENRFSDSPRPLSITAQARKLSVALGDTTRTPRSGKQSTSSGENCLQTSRKAKGRDLRQQTDQPANLAQAGDGSRAGVAVPALWAIGMTHATGPSCRAEEPSPSGAGPCRGSRRARYGLMRPIARLLNPSSSVRTRLQRAGGSRWPH